MKPASLSELKKELKNTDPVLLVEICLRLVKYKKENKELLTYLLFDADHEPGYVDGVKAIITESFEETDMGNLYRAAKAVRKILRLTNKYIKYSGEKSTEASLLIHYLDSLLGSGIRIKRSTALTNLYQRQVEKLGTVLSKMHEDLRGDYQEDLERLKKMY
jgi:hypothetical protein